jgi:hypothetical protein
MGITNSTLFCDQFPDHYSYASLRDFTLRPSPYNDYWTLMRIFNLEYVDGAARGCIGQVNTYPPLGA